MTSSNENRLRENEIARQLTEVGQFGGDLTSALLKVGFEADAVQTAIAPLDQVKANLRQLLPNRAENHAVIDLNRPGDMAAVYAQETDVDYSTALVHCNMD